MPCCSRVYNAEYNVVVTSHILQIFEVYAYDPIKSEGTRAVGHHLRLVGPGRLCAHRALPHLGVCHGRRCCAAKF